MCISYSPYIVSCLAITIITLLLFNIEKLLDLRTHYEPTYKFHFSYNSAISLLLSPPPPPALSHTHSKCIWCHIYCSSIYGAMLIVTTQQWHLVAAGVRLCGSSRKPLACCLLMAGDSMHLRHGLVLNVLCLSLIVTFPQLHCSREDLTWNALTSIHKQICTAGAVKQWS